MNQDQKALLQWITSGLQIAEVRQLYGDAGYLLSNMIAKYSLSASEYLLSHRAAERLLGDGVDLNGLHKRSYLYGKKSLFIYEHAIPASVVREQLLVVPPLQHEVQSVLSLAGPVAVILRDEDDLLRLHGLRSRMPKGWSWGDDPLARYHVAGFQISEQRIRMSGAIRR